MKPPFIKRVAIKNYKSIVHCDVELGSLQFLVGRNGSGKSNFLDALMFVRDVLGYDSLDELDDKRSGVARTLNGKMCHERTLSMELDINLDSDTTGFLSFQLKCDEKYRKFRVIKEECVIQKNDNSINSYRILNGKIQTDKNKQGISPVTDDSLYLKNTRSSPEFQMLYNALRSIQIYADNHFPALNENEDNDSVLKILSSLSPNARERIAEYMQLIVPSIDDNKPFPKRYGTKDKPVFLIPIQGIADFPLGSMSSGTLRALGILTATLREQDDDTTNFAPLVCIEEPETALHARAMAGMLSALEEASEKRQILVTTHSTEMLDNKEITSDIILPVEWRNSETVIGPLESVSKEMLNEHLTTAGELLRQNALNPEPSR